MMKIRILFLIAVVALAACNNASQNDTVADQEDNAEITSPLSEDVKVHVVYFHGKQRCRSCVTIQKVASETVAEVFGDNTDVEFVEIDFSLKENDAIAEKYEIAWSSLIIVSGDRHTNLTDAAFANAMSNPGTLKEMITEKIREYLNL